MAARLRGDPDAEAVGWLHDVLEDTTVTAAELRARFPARVVDAVVALTRLPGEDPDHHYARVGADPLARRVKLADLADNSDPQRLALLDPVTRARLEAKYAHAHARLGVGWKSRAADTRAGDTRPKTLWPETRGRRHCGRWMAQKSTCSPPTAAPRGVWQVQSG